MTTEWNWSRRAINDGSILAPLAQRAQEEGVYSPDWERVNTIQKEGN